MLYNTIKKIILIVLLFSMISLFIYSIIYKKADNQFFTLNNYLLLMFSIRSIPVATRFKHERYFRFFIMFLPMIIVLVIYEFPASIFKFSIKSLLSGLLFGIILLAMQFKSIKLLFSKDYLELLPKVSTQTFYLWNYMLIGAPFFEELFFRGLIFTIYNLQSLIFVLLINSIFFVLYHFLSFSNTNWYSFKDAVYFFLLSILSSFALIYTKSLVSSMIVHFVYNIPHIYSLWKRYFANMQKTYKKA